MNKAASNLPALPLALEQISEAADRIKHAAIKTPLVTNSAMNQRLACNAFLKPECLQRTGSFKFRGAYNRLSQLTESEREAGVVAWSSGNHAQGIAAAAQLLGINAAIVMPKDAPEIKLAKTRDYGAEIILYDRYTESREEIGHSLSESRGAVLVPSYDDLDIIAGQGTVGLEIAEQVNQYKRTLDVLLVCCGGGGLIAGISTALSSLSPTTEIYSVEPAGFDDHARSLTASQIVANKSGAQSICDALLAPQPGDITFSINRHCLAGGLVVTDEEVKDAMRFAFSELKLVLEPGGSVALAALLSGKLNVTGKSVGIVLSGGNVSPELFAEVIGQS